jgi:CYTH domain-containing protein
MSKEIERKFLVMDDSYKGNIVPIHIIQGFISTEKDKVVRVRIAGSRAFLTLKNDGGGITRNEFDYEIPYSDAVEIMEQMCGNDTLEKNRYIINYEGHTWEVDEFMGHNKGLVMAELELKSENEAFIKPLWLGKEVTSDVRYLNANLVRYPYKKWEHP